MIPETDGWERGPNPVAQIIAVRTAQVGIAAGVGLAGIIRMVPRERRGALIAGGGALVTGGLSAYFVATFHARTSFGYPLLTYLPKATGKAVAFTFDDGPHPETTPRLLDILAEGGETATFFLVAERARAYPRLAQRIAEAGHTIGVHGLRHRTMVLQSALQIERDMNEAVRVLEDATQTAPARLFRPPYGFKTWTLVRTANRLGWTIASWSLDPRDYDPHSPETLSNEVTSRLQPRDIILLHERPGIPTTPSALPAILQHCRKRGWKCVGLDSVLNRVQKAVRQSSNGSK